MSFVEWPEYRAVLADPEDDAPRLRFAQFVEARGEPLWAEFIRLQIKQTMDPRLEGARTGRVSWDEDRAPTTTPLRSHREEFLYRRGWRAWAEPILPLLEVKEPLDAWFVFHRGFIVGYRMYDHTFLKHGEELFRRAPVRMLILLRGEKKVPMSEVMASPLLQQLDVFGYTDSGRYDIEHVAACPYLTRCQWLQMRGGWTTFVESPHMRSMLRISFSTDGPGHRWRWFESDEQHPRPDGSFEYYSVVYGPMPEWEREQEQKYGYIPWFHWDQNRVDPLDAKWYVDRGILPRRAPGSPVDYDIDPIDGNPAGPTPPMVSGPGQ